MPDLAAWATWPAPNYVNPQTRGPQLWIVSSIFLSIATLCVAFRLYTRIHVRSWFGPDDGLVLIAYVSLSYSSLWSLIDSQLTSSPLSGSTSALPSEMPNMTGTNTYMICNFRTSSVSSQSTMNCRVNPLLICCLREQLPSSYSMPAGFSGESHHPV